MRRATMALAALLLLAACGGEGEGEASNDRTSTTDADEAVLADVVAVAAENGVAPTVQFYRGSLDDLCSGDRPVNEVKREIRHDLLEEYGADLRGRSEIVGELVHLMEAECPEIARRASTTTTRRATTTTSPPAWPESTVVAVVDGDTVDLADGRRVRLSIVDTPEVHNGVEPCGPEASAFTRDFILDEEVQLRRPNAPFNDTYGRVLAEVIRARDGASLNEALVRAGLARIDERFTAEDPDLARRLRAIDPGATSCAPVATAPPATTSPPTTAAPTTTAPTGGRYVHPKYAEAAAAGACDPSYPTVCIPTIAYWGRDIDCPDTDGQSSERGDLPPDPHFRAFPITGSDPHKLRSPQGTGCANW